jgi:multicomponent Na+:H+ antiporter subunit E
MKFPLSKLVIRTTMFLILWLVFDEGKLAGLVIGLPAAVLAAVISLRLLPPSSTRLRLGQMISLVWHFVGSSVVAGVDVAFRAFDPRLPLQRGFLTCDCKIPAGPRRDLFLAMSSLMPGSLPVEENKDGRIVLHCLDTNQNLADQMADNEARFGRIFGAGDA